MLDPLAVTVPDTKRTGLEPGRVGVIAGELDDPVTAFDGEGLVGGLDEARTHLDRDPAQRECCGRREVDPQTAGDDLGRLDLQICCLGRPCCPGEGVAAHVEQGAPAALGIQAVVALIHPVEDKGSAHARHSTNRVTGQQSCSPCRAGVPQVPRGLDEESTG